MTTTRTNRGGMSYSTTRRDRRAEQTRLKDFEQMKSREILGKLYRRHATGVWQFVASVAIIAAIIATVR